MNQVQMKTQAENHMVESIPSRLHHYNYSCADHEKTRAFYEDLLGLPLIAFWCEVEPSHMDGGKEIVMGHAFYGLADGSLLAFMNFPDPKLGAANSAKPQPDTAHLALNVTADLQAATLRRLRAAGHKVLEMDHGFVNSIYFKDPDGLTIEYSVDPDNVEQIYGEQKGGLAHDNMRRFIRGDHQRTNKWMPATHAIPEWK
jgi:catechol 2,3-dioxygenase-like lactoylglutathione lyase family enzyme